MGQGACMGCAQVRAIPFLLGGARSTGPLKCNPEKQEARVQPAAPLGVMLGVIKLG